MKWWNNQALIGISTVVGGMASIGYFSEKIIAAIPTDLASDKSSSLGWWEVLIGVAIILIPYVLLNHLLNNESVAQAGKKSIVTEQGVRVEHYSASGNYWRYGLNGFMLRLRGQISILFFSFIFLLYLK